MPPDPRVGTYTGQVHGERIVDGDATTLTALLLYEAGTVKALTLGAKDHLVITDVRISAETAGNYALLAGATAAAGKYIAEGGIASGGVIVLEFSTPFICPAGVTPYFSGSASNKSTCLIEGFIKSA